MNIRDFIRENDSFTIQAAVDAAEAIGDREVVIPAINPRTNENIYNITDAILLPSNITIVLDNCHLRMADGVISQMFRNKNALTELGTKQEGVQENIHIIGKGAAVLDGGNFNELNEFTSQKNGLPHNFYNLLICLCNVQHFSISGFRVLNQRWWSMALCFCEYGKVSDIEYTITNRDKKIWHNQDGVDIRSGCNNIIVENIRGEVGDDVVALTALSREGTFEGSLAVEGKSRDIHDVSVKNIFGYTTLCAIVRVLNHYGNKMYNINIENIHDISLPGCHSRSQNVVKIGDETQHNYAGNFPENRAKHGDTYNIRVHGVWSRALAAVQTATTVKNLHLSDIFVHTDGQYAWYCGHGETNKRTVGLYAPEDEEEQKVCRWIDLDRQGKVDFDEYKGIMENVVVENVFHSAKSLADEENGAIIVFNHIDLRNVVLSNVFTDSDLQKVRYRKSIGKALEK